MRRVKGTVLLAFVVVVAFSLAGCGLIAQKAVEQSTGVKVDQNGKSVTVTGKDGSTASMSAKEGELPKGLPADVPVYSGTVKASYVVEAPQQGGTNFMFTIQTADSGSTVMDWYKKQLEAKGWMVTGTVASGTDAGMVEAKKGANNSIIVTVSKDTSTGKTQAAIVETLKK